MAAISTTPLHALAPIIGALIGAVNGLCLGALIAGTFAFTLDSVVLAIFDFVGVSVGALVGLSLVGEDRKEESVDSKKFVVRALNWIRMLICVAVGVGVTVGFIWLIDEMYNKSEELIRANSESSLISKSEVHTPNSMFAQNRRAAISELSSNKKLCLENEAISCAKTVELSLQLDNLLVIRRFVDRTCNLSAPLCVQVGLEFINSIENNGGSDALYDDALYAIDKAMKASSSEGEFATLYGYSLKLNEDYPSYNYDQKAVSF